MDLDIPVLEHLPVACYAVTWPLAMTPRLTSRNIGRISGFPSPRFEEAGFWADRLHPEDRDEVLDGFGALHEGGEFAFEYRWKCADGQYRWFRDHGCVLPGESGGPARAVGLWEDVSKCVIVRNRERRLAAVLESTPDLAAIVSPSGEVEYMNDFGRKLLRIPPETEIRVNLFEDLPAPLAGKLRERCEAATADGFWRGEAEIVTADGRTLPVSEVVVSHLRPSGEVDFFSIVSRDLSGIKQLEARLCQAQKMEALGLLAGRIAHEFNNLVTVTVLCLDRLQELIGPKAPGRFEIEELQMASQRSQALSRQLWTASLQEPSNLEDFDLRDLVVDAVRMVRPAIGPGIDIETDLEPEPLVIHADRAQLELSLMNLLLNSKEAMAGGGRIAVSVQSVAACLAPDQSDIAQKGPFALLTVEDNGAGIAPEVLPRMFEPFFTTKAKGKGTGLGLTTVYATVKQAGGCILTSSSSGSGTRFDLCFPTRSGPCNPVSPDHEGTLIAARTSGILVVDDEESIRHAIGLALEEAGYPVVEASSAEQALDWLSSADTAPALIVTDILMPGMNGTELAERVLEGWPDTRLLFISGYTGDGFNLTRFRRNGADLLRKPFEPIELLKAVAVVLNRR